MQWMFYHAIAFNQPIGSWDVSTVGNMSGMFNSASSFNQDLSGWNVGSVSNMSYMFQNASSFDQSLATYATKTQPRAAVFFPHDLFMYATYS
jgi:surface protein